MERTPTVYIFAKGFRSTLYIGVTSDLLARIYQHRTEAMGGFTARYGIKRLVWFETGGSMESVIAREKRIKRWLREWKYALIEKDNPTWRDLAEDFGFEPLAPKKADPGSRPG